MKSSNVLDKEQASTLSFHPDFASPCSSIPVILQSKEGMCYYADITFLASTSGFFRDLQSVGLVSANSPMLLPSATSSGLTCSLQLLQAVSKGKPLPWSSNSLDAAIDALMCADAYDLHAAFDALIIADAYDLPAVGLLLKLGYLAQRPNNLFDILALFAATGDEHLAMNYSAKIACRTNYEQESQFG
ncbi:MAG: hypothetical protein TREMPRED_003321, partial [Tremellales sp. Tagirdzhanova-0007]